MNGVSSKESNSRYMICDYHQITDKPIGLGRRLWKWVWLKVMHEREYQSAAWDLTHAWRGGKSFKKFWREKRRRDQRPKLGLDE